MKTPIRQVTRAVLVALLAIGSVRAQQPAQTLAGKVVLAIDENYLYARTNPKWPQVRRELLSSSQRAPAATIEFVSRELDLLGDSDLNLFTTPQLQALQADVNGDRSGIGLVDFALDRDPGTHAARVVTPTDRSPAALAGVLPGDLIVSVDDRPTSTLSHEAVLDILRIKSQHRLAIDRQGRPVTISVGVSSNKLDYVRSSIDHSRGRAVGYLRIVQFTPEVSTSVRSELTRLAAENVDCLLLDLRNNPGGFLTEAQQMAGLFGLKSLGWQTQRDSEPTLILATGAAATQKPVAVLVNEGTASAAELLAAALGESGRATLVGTRTRGRAQVQTLQPLTDDVSLVIPVAVVKSLHGRRLKETGVMPQVRQRGDAVANSFGSRGDRQYQAGLQACVPPAAQQPG